MTTVQTASPLPIHKGTLHSLYILRFPDELILPQTILSAQLLKSKSPKKWFRAYFNHGLINYIYGNKRLLPCDMSKNAFFIDPFCDVIPCNGMEKKAVMGNLREQSWEELWNSFKSSLISFSKFCATLYLSLILLSVFLK